MYLTVQKMYVERGMFCFYSSAHYRFSPQFSQAVHSFTTLGVSTQHPYIAHDKPSVPILIFCLFVINGYTFKHAVHKYLQFFV